ncbi:chemotaxis protein CheW [Ferdinandcohnia quinoae]|uniref:Chemotaxis protein CheW n=1 Tax=Fredinandcohnia quinoae TaxID=2918902 RepID=A0AAW5E5Y9_9BACI|nr:chemotaxis protein CheW [Fredinandcohnia sp. SECRCQ15]MCH1626660.1 chemotaxis protein CheW [Fredinandcohnia sp. SECRCQ15]
MENKKVVVFSAVNEEFGLPVEHVISIEKFQKLTEIPQMPKYMGGVLTMRDELVPIIDSNLILFNKKFVHTEKTRIIVAKTDEISIGLIVDDAKEILDISPEQIKQLSINGYQSSAYISGVINLEGRLITLLQPTSLIESLEGINDIKNHVHSHQS